VLIFEPGFSQDSRKLIFALLTTLKPAGLTTWRLLSFR